MIFTFWQRPTLIESGLVEDTIPAPPYPDRLKWNGTDGVHRAPRRPWSPGGSGERTGLRVGAIVMCLSADRLLCIEIWLSTTLLDTFNTIRHLRVTTPLYRVHLREQRARESSASASRAMISNRRDGRSRCALRPAQGTFAAGAMLARRIDDPQGPGLRAVARADRTAARRDRGHGDAEEEPDERDCRADGDPSPQDHCGRCSRAMESVLRVIDATVDRTRGRWTATVVIAAADGEFEPPGTDAELRVIPDDWSSRRRSHGASPAGPRDSEPGSRWPRHSSELLIERLGSIERPRSPDDHRSLTTPSSGRSCGWPVHQPCVRLPPSA